MKQLADSLGVSVLVLGLIALLVVVQIGLAIYALADLWKRDRVAGGRKWIWLILILIGNLAGPILYLVVGRDVPPEVAEQPVTYRDTSLSQTERIRRAVDALYGPVQ